MKVPTDNELAERQGEPDDPTLPPEIPVPVFIPVNQDDFTLRDYQDKLAKYHWEFLMLAIQEGCQVNMPGSIESPVQEEEFILVTDLLQDTSLLERDLKTFCEHVREVARKARQGYKDRQGVMAGQFLAEYSRDPRGTIKRIDFSLLDNVLAAHKLGLDSPGNLPIAVAMGLVADTRDPSACKSAEKKVARWRKKARSLIDAAASGRFVEELSESLRDK